MDRRRSSSIWPMFCIVGCLLVLGVVAPRVWLRARVPVASEPAAAAPADVRPAATTFVLPTSATARPSVIPPVVRPLSTTSVGLPTLVEIADPTQKFAGPLLDPINASWEPPALKPAGLDETPSLPPMESIGDEEIVERKLEEAAKQLAEPTPAPTRLPPVVESPVVAPAPKPAVAAKPAAAKPAAAKPPAKSSARDRQTAAAEKERQERRRRELELEKQLEQEAAAIHLKAYGWHQPQALIGYLEDLGDGPGRRWAAETKRLLDEWLTAMADGSDDLHGKLEALERQAEIAADAEGRIDDSADRRLRRAAFALERQVAVWKQAIAVGGPVLTHTTQSKVDPGRLALSVERLATMNDGSPTAEQWRRYLMIDSLGELARRPAPPRGGERLAQRVLARLHRGALNDAQAEFVAGEAFQQLKGQLRHWAAEPVDLRRLVEEIEQFECDGRPSRACLIAASCRRLGFSPEAADRLLAEQVEGYYRNANFRLSISQSLVDRLMPTAQSEFAPVDDVILGYSVRGRSLTASTINVRFVPDDRRLRMVFEVTGQVAADTTSRVGPATFFNNSDAVFVARKPLELDARGITLSPVDVVAHNTTRLRSLQTTLDWVPLLGGVAQQIARNQHELSRPTMNREAERRISQRARQRIDEEAYERLTEGVDRVRERLFVPLNTMALQPLLVSGKTTEERMTMRLRLAGDDQLAANTPRPRAPEGSLASLQIHESAINNVLERLDLSGKEMSPAELSAHVSKRLNRPEAWPVDPANDDVLITFADVDALRVRCRDGQVNITVAIARLSKAQRVWRNFQVRVNYRPQQSGTSVELVRDGVIQLIGPRLTPGAQIAVRGIFAKVFAKDTAMQVIPPSWLDDPRLKGLAVSQFVIEDGWIGAAVSAAAEDEQTIVARR